MKLNKKIKYKINLRVLWFLCIFFVFITCKTVNNNNLDINESHVFLIGLDGWGSYSFNDIRFNMPSVQELMNNGSYTLEALNVMPSISLPNWSSMLMGAGPDITGYKTNNPQDNKYGPFPSIFTLLKEQKPQCKAALFYEWSTIRFLCPNGTVDKKRRSSLSWSVSYVRNYIIKEKPHLTVILINQPDTVGHSAGHNTDAYYNELNRLDGIITQILESIKTAGIWNNSIIILSSDHGGLGKTHGGDTPMERNVPFIIAGDNIIKNNKIPQSVRIFDIASTIAHIFNLKAPSFWEGKVINIFENDDMRLLTE